MECVHLSVLSENLPFSGSALRTLTIPTKGEAMNTARLLVATAAFAFAGAATGLSAADAYVESLKANTIFTDYYANPNSRIELDFQYLAGDYGDSSVAHGGMIIGPWNSGCGLATALWNASGATGLQFIIGDDTSKQWPSSGQTISDARRFLSIDCHTGKLQMATHGATTTNEVDSGATFTQTASWPVSLLGASKSADGSAIDAGQVAKARIFGCKIYEWDETSGAYTLVRDYVPVLRDGQPCLRDSVTGSFALDPRKGAAALAYGGDIEEVGGGYIQSVIGIGLNTGYHMKETSRVELDAALASASSVVRPMGCWNGASSMRYLVWTSSSKVQFFLNSGSSSGQGPAIDTDRHTWVFDAAGNEGRYLTGSTVIYSKSGTAPSSGATSSNPLGLFADAANTTGTSWSQPATGMKCYGLKIYESDVLVMDLVPYVRNGEAGFRDTLTDAFLSTGTTNFVARGNLAFSGPTAKDAFVESDGTQVINTGYHVSGHSRVEVDLAVRSGNRGFLFGNFASGAGLRWSAWLNSGPLRFSSGPSGSNTTIMSPGPESERIKAVFDVENSQGWVVRNGVTEEKKTIAASTLAEGDTCAFPMGVFGSLANEEGTKVDTSISPATTAMRVYSVRIYEGDTLAAEFLPYKGAEGIGLYDTKTGNVALKHSDSVADPTIGGMGVDGAEKWLVTPAETTAVPVNRSATVSANAAGALSYVWTIAGETVAGATGPSVSVPWQTGTHGRPVVGTVSAVYDVFGTETVGSPVPFSITYNPAGFLILVK